MGVWVEIVTLLIPGFNDSEDELSRLTEFVAGVSPDIPWHVTAFHADYRQPDTASTTPAMLVRAAAVGKRAGLRFVYAGNLPGRVGRLEDTACAGCGAALVERDGYHIRGYHLTAEGRCPACGIAVPGRWDRSPERQIADAPFLPRLQQRLGILSRV